MTGIIYGFFEVFPISFQEQRGWNLGVGALPFLGVMIGVVLGCLGITLFTKTRFKKVVEHEGLVPEERLIPMMVASFLLPGGLFWFAWTSSPNITPWPQIVSCVPIGKSHPSDALDSVKLTFFRRCWYYPYLFARTDLHHRCI